MEPKDWIILLVPIFCNGLVIFILQKIFEKKLSRLNIKRDYFNLLRQKVDISLELHAKSARLANERSSGNDDEINRLIRQFVESCLDGYYYYIQNKNIFCSMEKLWNSLSQILLELCNGVNEHRLTSLEISNKINTIRDKLLEIKDLSML